MGKEKSIYSGKPISFRLNDCPDSIIDYLNDKKEKIGRDFSKFLNATFQEAISEKMENEGERIVLTLPGELTQEQREWINNPLSKELLSRWVYQMIMGEEQSSILTEKQLEKDSSTSETFKTSKYHSNLASSFFEDDD